MRIAALLLVVVSSTFALSQGFEVTGGGSTLMGAEGGEAKIVFKDSETALGGGTFNGHAFFGGTETVHHGGWDYVLGMAPVPWSLPSDYQGAGQAFPGLGVLVSHGRDDNRLAFFAGATSQAIIFPFAYGVRATTPTLGLWWTKRLTDTLRFDSAEVMSSRATAIQSLTWTPLVPLSFTGAAGMGSNAPFLAGRAEVKTAHWRALINDTRRAADFRRVALYYVTQENSGVNVSGGFTSHPFNINADRLSFESVVGKSVIASTVSSISAGGAVSIFRANASDFFGTSNGLPVSGRSFGAGVSYSRFSVTASRYVSPRGSSASLTATQRLTRHLSANEFYEGHDFNIGGTYTSNRFDISAGESMSYFPVVNSFRRVESISVRIRLPGGLQASGQTVTLPTGATKMTAMLTKYGEGPMSTPDKVSGPVGKYQFVGTVKDSDGRGIQGAVQIGKAMVYADSEGRFVLPTRRNKPAEVTCLPDEFIEPGGWVVVSQSVKTAIKIIVRRK